MWIPSFHLIIVKDLPDVNGFVDACRNFAFELFARAVSGSMACRLRPLSHGFMPQVQVAMVFRNSGFFSS